MGVGAGWRAWGWQDESSPIPGERVKLAPVAGSLRGWGAAGLPRQGRGCGVEGSGGVSWT